MILYSPQEDPFKNEKFKAYEAMLLEHNRVKREKNKLTQFDIVLALGGDGALLRTIHNNFSDQCTYFGIGCGTVNFNLNEIPLEELNEIIDSIDERMTIVKTHALKLLYRGLGFNVINEVIIGGELNANVHFDCQDKEMFMGQFSGHAIIVSTAIGSTGWNKQNNAPIIPLTSSNMVVSTVGCTKRICSVIEPMDITVSTKSRHNVMVYIDGSIQTLPLEPEEKIVVTSGAEINLGFLNIDEYKKKRRM